MRLSRYSATATLVLLTCALTACHPSRPLVDTGAKPPDPQGSLSGTVRAASDGTPLANRLVHAVNSATGARLQVRTNPAGGFTLQVPPGNYRLEVELQAGEALVDPPGQVEVGPADLSVNIELKVGRAGG